MKNTNIRKRKNDMGKVTGDFVNGFAHHFVLSKTDTNVITMKMSDCLMPPGKIDALFNHLAKQYADDGYSVSFIFI